MGTTDDLNFIVFADGDGAGVVFVAEFFGERGAHDLATDAGGSGEVGLAALASGGADVCL